MPDSCANAAHQNVLLDSINDVSTPLVGTVICCTSVPDEKRVSSLRKEPRPFSGRHPNSYNCKRSDHLLPIQTKLAAQAEQMGAVHRYDLTLDVTHLIVGKYDTEKYRYVARERPDVRPMTVEWIEAVRELWINDQEIDIAQLEREQTLPTLHSLKFSMTGCDDRKITTQ
jgi:DNA replication regulator DPB11